MTTGWSISSHCLYVVTWCTGVFCLTMMNWNSLFHLVLIHWWKTMCVPLCWQPVSDQTWTETLNCCNLNLRTVHNECFTNDDDDDNDTGVDTWINIDQRNDTVLAMGHKFLESAAVGSWASDSEHLTPYSSKSPRRDIAGGPLKNSSTHAGQE